MPGIIACTIAISCFSLANGSVLQWIALWVLYAVISISVKTTVWTAAIVGSFTAGQGLALGVMLSGTAAAQMILPPLATWLVGEFGWRASYVWLGCGWGAFTFFVCWLFLRDVHSKPTNLSSGGGFDELNPPPGLGVTEALKDMALWRVAISTFVMMVLTIGLLIHQIPILTEAGVSRINAAWLASLAGAAGIAGKLIAGALLDRFQANWVGGITLASTGLAFALLIDGVQNQALIVVAMVVNGYSAGSKLQIASYLTARYGGLRNFGVIYGVITSLVALGSGTGPMIAGLVYDLTGAYTAFLIAGAVGSMLCGLLILTLPRYPQWAQ